MISPNIPRETLDQLDDGVYVVDLHRTIGYWNPAAEQITGYRAAEAVGQRCWHNLLRHVDDHGHQLCQGWCPLIATMQDGHEREADVYLHHKAGHRVPVKVRTVPIRQADGAITGAVEYFYQRAVERLPDPAPPHLSAHSLPDELSGLDSRAAMERQIRSRLEAQRHGGALFGLLLLHLDTADAVAARHGESVRDNLRQAVARTLLYAVRKVDAVATWDEQTFAVVLQGLSAAELGDHLARLRFLIEQTFLIVEHRIIRFSSIAGMAHASDDDSLESLAARAEASLARA
jgi:PAS domain S-box-containing protein/diguanylate cyclase (GGDEF)-like protein